MKMASFWGSLRQTKMMRRCARKRERERSRKGVAEQPDLTGIQSSSSQLWRKPTSNYCSLAASTGMGERERREGCSGYL
jgi:hypothetical protein